MHKIYIPALVLLVTVNFNTKAQNKAVELLPPVIDSVFNYSKVIGWIEGKKPVAPDGFTVGKFADGFDNPRWIYVAPNGDIFVSEAATQKPEVENEQDRQEAAMKAPSQNLGSADRITMFRDTEGNGTYRGRYIYKTELNQPFGMLVLRDHFYVANTDGILRFPYNPADTALLSTGDKILELPAGGYNNHWTRNIISDPAAEKIYISVGSASNNGEYGLENEMRRANILVIDPDGSNEYIYAAGLRNPVGIDWNPVTGELWAVVNERDHLGDDLVPDYATSVKPGGFYGWPYAYLGQNEDPRMLGIRPDLVAETIVPDIPLVSHTASLGLSFYKEAQFPERYRNGIFIGQHGSWNRRNLSGYRVVFVPFMNGVQVGDPEDFLTGFIHDADRGEVYGRPVCVTVIPDGSLLVSDDSSNTIWKVTYN